MPVDRSRRLALCDVASAAGGRSGGLAGAPAALRGAGLVAAAAAAGFEVVDLGEAGGAPFQADDAHPRCRNVEGVALGIRAASEAARRALGEGFALLLGGDCTLVAGTVEGAWKALGAPVGLVFVDADADLNTPDTTPSGYLHGMALALAMGRGPEAARSGAPVDSDHVSLVGFRALDPGERSVIGELGLALPASAARKLGMRTTAALALDGVGNGDGPVVVHFDVDVVDAAELPAKEPLVGGEALSLDEAGDLLTALLASPRVVGLELMELDAHRDPEGACARRLVEMLGRALARRARAGA